VRILTAALVLAFALGMQVAVGKIWTDAYRYLDLMLLPVIWYAIFKSPRSALLIGCASGLMQDAWFQAGVFGLSGFKRTLLGWALGSLGSRVDLNSKGARVASGILVSVADSSLDQALRRLLDLETHSPGVVEILIRAIVTGVLVSWSFSLTQRVRQHRMVRRLI
jgi:rod shape-determining protein MreD